MNIEIPEQDFNNLYSFFLKYGTANKMEERLWDFLMCGLGSEAQDDLPTDGRRDIMLAYHLLSKNLKVTHSILVKIHRRYKLDLQRID